MKNIALQQLLASLPPDIDVAIQLEHVRVSVFTIKNVFKAELNGGTKDKPTEVAMILVDY